MKTRNTRLASLALVALFTASCHVDDVPTSVVEIEVPTPSFAVIVESVEDLSPGWFSATAEDVSESGAIAGRGDSREHGIVAISWLPTGEMRLRTGLPGDDRAWAVGGNSQGELVGETQSFTPPRLRPAFWSADGTPTEVTSDVGGGRIELYDINDAGTAVGYLLTPQPRVFLWNLVAGGRLLPGLEDAWGVPRAINEQGHVVGTYLSPHGDSRAFLWTPPATVTDIPTFGLGGGIANGLNERGEVVGWATANATNARVGALYWSAATGTLRLPDAPGFDVSLARDIDDHGHIVGAAVGPRGFQPAIWETPTSLPRFVDDSRGEILAINNDHVAVGWSRRFFRNSSAVKWTLNLSPDAAEILTQLQVDVAALETPGALNHGQANSLSVKLAAAIAKIERGQAASAIHQIEAFIHEVEAYVQGGNLTAGQGNPWLAAAELAIGVLVADG